MGFIVGFIMGVLCTLGAQSLYQMSLETAEPPAEEDQHE